MLIAASAGSNFTSEERRIMDALMKVDMRDRKQLLAASTDRLLGMIMRLNRMPRYHNTLDAIALTSRLIEMKERKNKIPLSSPKDTVPS